MRYIKCVKNALKCRTKILPVIKPHHEDMGRQEADSEHHDER